MVEKKTGNRGETRKRVDWRGKAYKCNLHVTIRKRLKQGGNQGLTGTHVETSPLT
jgi:hypothetical protein